MTDSKQQTEYFVMFNVLLWLSGLASLGLLIYALGIPVSFDTPPGNLLSPTSSNYDVYLPPDRSWIDSRSDFPAAPRLAVAPLYLSPNGRQQGVMDWWEYIDPSQPEKGYVNLNSQNRAATSDSVTRNGKEVGSWVRLSDLSFDLRDVARHAGSPVEAQRDMSSVEIADLNADGLPECLEVRYESSAMRHDGYSLSIYGTPNGKPVPYLNFAVLKQTNIEEIKLANGTCAIVTNGLLWNNYAYRWRNGQFRRCNTPLVLRRATLHRRFWRQVLVSFFSSSLLLIVLPVIWICCLIEKWQSASNTRSCWMIMKLCSLLAVLLLLAWRVYRYFGYEAGAAWRFAMFGCAAAAILVILLIPIVRTWRENEQETEY